MPAPDNNEFRGLTERLADGPVICAEGYVFELERRGYLQAGPFVPEVVLDHPDVVAQVHREFVHAGSDVIEAFTYYAHREKLRLIGKEDLLEPMNRQALQIAHSVAAEAEGERPLVAGNICNTNIYDPSDPAAVRDVERMFEEMLGWIVDEGADYVIAETLYYLGEAKLALEAIQRAGLTAVVTLGLPFDGDMVDGPSAAEACHQLADLGATVVGLNCLRGPGTMLPDLRSIRERVDCHVAALPVPYRTGSHAPTFLQFRDPDCDSIPDGMAFPTALEPFHCNRFEIADFARAAYALDIRYLGLCCGNSAVHLRAMAEALGRETPASRYSPEMSKHFALGSESNRTQRQEDFFIPPE